MYLTSLTKNVTALTGLPNEWDQIVFFDVSGMGMQVTFDEMWLITVSTSGTAMELTGLQYDLLIS